MTNLAPPGAGLPLPELFIAQIRFRLICWSTNDQQALEQFQRTQADILERCREFSQQKASTEVLIKRLRGLEDSSRNWSVYLTLEHLCIVNDSIGDTCVLLSQGSCPPSAVSTADVKPSSRTGPEVIKAFEESCAEFVKKIGAIDNLQTTTKFAHPWFGPLDASKWLTMAAFHMRLHLAQILRIGETIA
jgi:hypothetical protein